MKIYFRISKKEIVVYVTCILLFTVLLYPILEVGFHNYPSGDDYWFGVYTYQGYIHSGIVGAIKGSFSMVAEIYDTWQGTWFTLFLFTLSPHNFNEKAYVISVFISLIGLAGAEFIILKRYLYNEYKFSRIFLVSIFFVLFNLSIQYIPRTTSGIFWFNGIMHYTIPFFIAMECINLSRFVLSDVNRDKKHILPLAIIVLGMIALGGSNYLAAIIGFMGVVYELLVKLLDEWKDKSKVLSARYIVFLLAILLEFVGLYISYKSPGNSIRANDDMSFRPKYFLKCIYWSIDRSRLEFNKMFQERPVLWLFLFIAVVLVALELFYKFNGIENDIKIVKHPIVALFFVNGTHAATYMPEVYAASDVSGGVPNTHYWLLLLILLVDVIIVEDILIRIVGKFKKNMHYHSIDNKKFMIVQMASILVAIIGTFVYILEGPQITTDDYCNDYIASGRMAEYENVWWTAYDIFTNPEIEDAMVPDYYGDVYPVCHMTLSDDSKNNHNVNRARYYSKKSVTAYEFDRENN